MEGGREGERERGREGGRDRVSLGKREQKAIRGCVVVEESWQAL